MRFWLGTHLPHWLSHVDVPLFVSRTRLQHRTTLPRARGPWALDSGAFSELQRFGEWTITPAEDVAFVRRCAEDIGHLQWAAYAGTGSVHSRLIIHDDRKVAGRVH